ncbi:methionyl-tRNA formyltransferase [Fructilactobacillus frigidiflavus]|uniref:methionyl-tRNA formyltransferase n=1 Tax=Fructilactobacillus frigidiflavus TaxID=3242688 RepID=UPI0037573C36
MKSIVFMGTPEFSVPILQALNQQYKVQAVITQPDRPVGRKRKIIPTPVKQAAVDLNLPVYQPEKLSGSEAMQTIIDLQPDFIVTAAYGQFLPTKLLNAAKIAAVNVHGSLLPKYRGGAPVQYAIMNGDQETGITIMYMVKAMDAGDIISQQAVAITDQDDTASMFTKLSLVGRDLLLATLPKIADGEINPQKQDESQVVFSPNIKREEEVLDFNQSARKIDCKVRALRPDPIAYAFVDGKRFKIWDTSVTEQKTDLKPGQVVYRDKHTLQIAAGDGTVLQLNEVQPAGKPKKTITDFLNGNQKLTRGDQFIDER